MEEANTGVRLSRVRPAQVGRLREDAGCRAASPVGLSRSGRPARSGWPLTQPDILQPVGTAWVNGESVQRRLPSVDVRRVVERDVRGVLGNQRLDLLRSEEHTSELQSPCNL